jgi:predicted transcriptional regulator
MKTTGKELRAIQEELGVTPVEVCAEADVSIATLYNVYAEKRVSANTVNRVKKALSKLRTKSKAAG